MSADDFKKLRELLVWLCGAPDERALKARSALAILARIEAREAAMREALEAMQDKDGHIDACGNGGEDPENCSPLCNKVSRALATDAGAGLLARLREHEGCTERARLATRLNKALMERAEKAEAERDLARAASRTNMATVSEMEICLNQTKAERDEARGEVTRLEFERDALRAFEANVRELLAKASTPGKGPTHYCAHCLASFDGPEATNEHARACPQSPVARENAALRAAFREGFGIALDSPDDLVVLGKERERLHAEVERLRADLYIAQTKAHMDATDPDALAQARREERERVLPALRHAVQRNHGNSEGCDGCAAIARELHE